MPVSAGDRLQRWAYCFEANSILKADLEKAMAVVDAARGLHEALAHEGAHPWPALDLALEAYDKK